MPSIFDAFPSDPAPPGRSFSDPQAARTAIYDRVKNSVAATPPIKTHNYTLTFHDLDYEDRDDFDHAPRKQAILSGGTLDRRLRGTIRMSDNATGQPIAEKRMTFARVPTLTDAGTFVINGVNYSLANQSRLMSGAYVRQSDSGEIEGFVNPEQGKGRQHRYVLDPKTGVFKLKVEQSYTPLLPILEAMGTDPKAIEAAWGPELVAINKRAGAKTNLDKLAAKLRNRDTQGSTTAEIIKNSFLGMPISPEVTHRTLGQAFTNVSPEMILATTRKVLGVQKGEADSDDRDAMAYQKVLGPEDLMAERAAQSMKALQPYLWKLNRKGDINQIPSNFLGRNVSAAIQSSGLGQALDEPNPLDLLVQLTRISKSGYGGITSSDAVPLDCYDDQTEVLTSTGWRLWGQVSSDDPLACLINGTLEYHRPVGLHAKHYTGTMYGCKTRTLDYLVTPTHRNWVRKYRTTGCVKTRGMASWGFELASETNNSPRDFLITHAPFKGNESLGRFVLPAVPGSRKHYEFSIVDWAEFLGWFIAEGSIDSYALTQRSKYQITITQTMGANAPKVERIRQLLGRMGIAHSYQTKNFVFTSKQLGYWLQNNVGIGSHNKHIPEECFSWPVAARQTMLDALISGDGSRLPSGGAVYASCSRVLVRDVERLATTLGLAVSMHAPDTRRWENAEAPNLAKRKVNDHYVCGILVSKVQGVHAKERYEHNYYTTEYDGMIYCATVPGELLLVRRNKSTPMWSGNSRMVQPTQLGYIDSIFSPESASIGIDSRLSANSWKGTDGKIYTPAIDLKTNRKIWASPDMLDQGVLALPNELDDPNEQFPRVIKGGRLGYAHRDQVTHVLPDMDGTFNPVSQLIPGKSGAKANRTSMAARMLAQSLPLVNPEAPYVQSAVPGSTQSFQEKYGTLVGAVRAKQPGTVESVEEGKVTVRNLDGSTQSYSLHVNTPNNRKSALHNTPTVQTGDRVDKDGLIASSNFTDNQGTIAVGSNLRAAYIPYQGQSFEDALVISKAAAKKLTSMHLYQHDVELSPETRKGKNAFVSLFPSTFDREQLDSLDEHGIVKPGTEVAKGSPLVLRAKAVDRGHQRVTRGRNAGFSDDTEVWDHDEPGLVTDTVMTKHGVNVVVVAKREFKSGDKLSGLYGDKGIVSKVVDDEEMPHDKDGKPFDILINPLTVITRLNPVQLVEAALGKIADKTKVPYKLKDFDQSRNMTQYALEELKKHGIPEKEDLIDPVTRRVIPNVFTGNRYFLKLHHQGEDKLQGRGLGSYSSDDAPSKSGGSEGSSKRVALMDVAALMSHGAYNMLRDIKEIRSQRNADYWADLMAGQNPKPPRVSAHHERFIAQLQAAGINPVRNGPKIRLQAMTDQDVDGHAEDREITSPDTVDITKGLKPVSGGLMDPGLTGGHGGTTWSKITFAQPLPNPVFEEPIRKVLGLTESGFRDIIGGTKELNGKTGPQAIKSALEAIDLDRETAAAENAWRKSKRADRDSLTKRWSLLEHAKRQGLHPKDWMSGKVAVIPPKFRPITVLGDSGLPLVADANYLYGDLIRINQGVKKLQQHTTDQGEEHLALYDAYKAVIGLGDPVTPKNQERGVKGILKSVFGDGPKYSCYDDRTELLTQDGWKLFTDVKQGDMSATLHPVTGMFEWQPVQALHQYDHDGDMYEIKTKRGLSISVTKGHRHWVKHRDKTKKTDLTKDWKFICSEELHTAGGRDWIRTAALGWKGKFSRPEFLETVCPMASFARLVGWWAAEGWFGHLDKSVQISQASDVNAEKCKDIEAVISELGLRYSVGDYVVTPKKPITDSDTIPAPTPFRLWTVWSPELVDWLKINVGRGAGGKKLSRQILDWPTELLAEFMRGYLLGDGSTRGVARVNNGGVTHGNSSMIFKDHTNSTTISKELADNIQEIACKLGVTSRISIAQEADPEFNTKTQWRNNLSGSSCVVIEGPHQKFKTEYTGKVYCVTVPNGIVFVRRDNKPFFSGNSLQQKLLGSRVDTVGRGVIIPDPDLNMDEVGIPEDRAWTTYSPWAIRRLVRRGIPGIKAKEMVDNRTDMAKSALMDEMKERPVVIVRAPTLHRYGSMAFYPKLVTGAAIRLTPIVAKGYGADHDGDQVNWHVPVSDAAVDDAREKMLPSRNLLSTKTFKPHYLPSNEFAGGIYQASTEKSQRPVRTFKRIADVVKAWHDGTIGHDDVVSVLESHEDADRRRE